MAKDKKIYLAEFDANNEPYLRKLTEAEKKTIASSEKMQNSLKKLSNAFLPAVTIGSAISFIDKSIDAFIEQEKVIGKLEKALKKSSQSLQQFASQLQKTTTFGDEEILNAMSRIAIYVKEESQIKKLTQATLDFAYAKDIDLSTAAELVAKTVAGTSNALQRYGIELEKTYTITDRVNAVSNALFELFGGQATGALETAGGKLQNLKNQLSDISEELGRSWLPIWINFLEVLNVVGKVITYDTSPWNKDRQAEWKQQIEKLKKQESSSNGNTSERPSFIITPEDIKNQKQLFEDRKKKLEEFKKKEEERKRLIQKYVEWTGATSPLGFDSTLPPRETNFPTMEQAAANMKEVFAKNLEDIMLEKTTEWLEESAENFLSRMNQVNSIAYQFQSIFNIAADTFVGKLISGVDTVVSILNLLSSISQLASGSLFFGKEYAKGGTVINKNGRVSVSEIPHFASGGSFMVPPGYSGDNYPIMVKSGERIDITPTSQVPHITELLRQINNSIQASTKTNVKAKQIPVVVNLSLDGKSLTRTSKHFENNLVRGGQNFDEL